MIVLTQEQVNALQSPEPTRMHVVNPHTSEMFVLVPLAPASSADDDDIDYDSWTEEERDMLRLEACDILDSWGKNT